MSNTMTSMNDLMINGLCYALDFENNASRAASTMAESSSDPEVKQVFQESVAKGKEYAQRVEQVFQNLGQSSQTKDNAVVEAMIHEVEGMIDQTEASPVRDAALIVAANQMQHYRIAVYGSLAHYAQLLDRNDAAEPLQRNLEESKGGDEKLTRIGEQSVNQEAARAAAYNRRAMLVTRLQPGSVQKYQSNGKGGIRIL